MKVFGLTGGVGMGKTTAAHLLSETGVAMVDTDLLARQIVQPGQSALGEIQAAFGKEIVSPEGQLRRDELARIVFGDPAARKKLEAIMHPRIRALWQAQVETWRKEGRSIAVVVIPLLFETDAASHFDKTICVACSAVSQHERLLNRGWSPEQIAQRLAAQLPISRKMELSDHVVWTEGSLETLAAQWRCIIV